MNNCQDAFLFITHLIKVTDAYYLLIVYYKLQDKVFFLHLYSTIVYLLKSDDRRLFDLIN